jgi:hypothetical protein
MSSSLKRGEAAESDPSLHSSRSPIRFSLIDEWQLDFANSFDHVEFHLLSRQTHAIHPTQDIPIRAYG